MKGMKTPSPAMVVAMIALLLAVGGTAYAGAKLAKNSVGTKQLKKNAVTSPKVKDGSLTATDFQAGSLPAGPRGPQGTRGPEGDTGPQGPSGRSALTPLADGETVKGVIGLDGHNGNAIRTFGTSASFPIPGSTGPTAYYVNGETPGETCSSDEFNPTAPSDTVCIYLASDNIEPGGFSFGAPGDRNLGFTLIATTEDAAGDIYFEGTWAFTEGPD